LDPSFRLVPIFETSISHFDIIGEANVKYKPFSSGLSLSSKMVRAEMNAMIWP